MYDKPVLGFLFLFFPPLKKTFAPLPDWVRCLTCAFKSRATVAAVIIDWNVRMECCAAMRWGEWWAKGGGYQYAPGQGLSSFFFFFSLSTIHREEHSSNANWCQHTAHKTSTHTPLPDGVQCLSARVVNTPQNISPERRRRRRKKTSR